MTITGRLTNQTGREHVEKLEEEIEIRAARKKYKENNEREEQERREQKDMETNQNILSVVIPLGVIYFFAIFYSHPVFMTIVTITGIAIWYMIRQWRKHVSQEPTLNNKTIKEIR